MEDVVCVFELLAGLFDAPTGNHSVALFKGSDFGKLKFEELKDDIADDKCCAAGLLL